MTSSPAPSRAHEHLAEAQRLVAPLVGALDEIGYFYPVSTAATPAPYARLLAHSHHMTVAHETDHGPVAVRVVSEHRAGDHYARTSLLSRLDDGKVVQFGAMAINLTSLPAAGRAAIETHAAPLGRVLIEQGVLREVEVRQLWRIAAGPLLAEHLAVPLGGEVFGRSARILVGGQPAVEVLEIVTI